MSSAQHRWIPDAYMITAHFFLTITQLLLLPHTTPLETNAPTAQCPDPKKLGGGGVPPARGLSIKSAALPAAQRRVKSLSPRPLARISDFSQSLRHKNCVSGGPQPSPTDRDGRPAGRSRAPGSSTNHTLGAQITQCPPLFRFPFFDVLFGSISWPC